MKGYRVVALRPDRSVPNEEGEIHHFSSSLERSEWWAERLPQEDVQYVPSVFDYAMNGYAIVEVEAEEVEEDRFFPDGEDFKGKIKKVFSVVKINPIQKRMKK